MKSRNTSTRLHSRCNDFLSKFEGKTEDEGSEIIGHFGLGFYSAFMVADTVEIDSFLSEGCRAAKWRCNGGIDYEMEAVKEPNAAQPSPSLSAQTARNF